MASNCQQDKSEFLGVEFRFSKICYLLISSSNFHSTSFHVPLPPLPPPQTENKQNPWHHTNFFFSFRNVLCSLLSLITLDLECLHPHSLYLLQMIGIIKMTCVSLNWRWYLRARFHLSVLLIYFWCLAQSGCSINIWIISTLMNYYWEAF